MYSNKTATHEIGAKLHIARNTCSYRVNIFCILDSVNKASLEKIIKSMFVLCLDKPHGAASSDVAVCEDAVMSITVNQVLHGAGSNLNSCNRWADKIFQVLIIIHFK